MAGVDNGMLYHLVQKESWDAIKASGKPYFPPTYEQDGFIHLTKISEKLLIVANHFYKDVPGDHVVLGIESAKLKSEVKFEPAAPVGDKDTYTKDEVELFPHLYGTIDFDSVVQELKVKRDTDGSFLHIEFNP